MRFERTSCEIEKKKTKIQAESSAAHSLEKILGTKREHCVTFNVSPQRCFGNDAYTLHLT